MEIKEVHVGLFEFLDLGFAGSVVEREVVRVSKSGKYVELEDGEGRRKWFDVKTVKLLECLKSRSEWIEECEEVSRLLNGYYSEG